MFKYYAFFSLLFLSFNCAAENKVDLNIDHTKNFIKNEKYSIDYNIIKNENNIIEVIVIYQNNNNKYQEYFKIDKEYYTNLFDCKNNLAYTKDIKSYRYDNVLIFDQKYPEDWLKPNSRVKKKFFKYICENYNE